MARPGRAPKPANLRLLHGDRKDRINTAEPRPRLLPAKKPGWLSPLAAEEWDRVAPNLDAMGIVKAVDATALGLYCEAVARFRSAQELLVKSGPLIRDRDGALRKNPLVAQARDASNEVRLWAQEFGVTPSARAGIHVDPARDGMHAERLLT